MPLRNRVTIRFESRLPDHDKNPMVFEPANSHVEGGFLVVVQPQKVGIPHNPVSASATPYVEEKIIAKRTLFPTQTITQVVDEEVWVDE